MTKENLIDVYNILKDYIDKRATLEFDAEVIRCIKLLTDSDIEIIKQSPYPWHTFKLLSSIDFKENISPETRVKIIDIINGAKKETIDYTYTTADCIATWQESTEYLPNFDDEDTIIKILTSISNAKGYAQSRHAFDIVRSVCLNDYPDEERLPELVDTITTCRTDTISGIVCKYLEGLSDELIWLDSTLDIAKKLATARNGAQALWGLQLVENHGYHELSNIETNEEREQKASKLVPIVTLVTREKNTNKAKDLYDVLSNSELIAAGIEYEAACLVKKAYRQDGIIPAKEVAQCELAINNLPNDTFLALIKTVGNIENMYIARTAANVATSKNTILIAPKQICNLTRIIGESAGDVQAYWASNLTMNINVLNSGYAPSLVSIVANAQTPYQASYAHSFASEPNSFGVSNAIFLATEASKVKDGSKLAITNEQMENDIREITSRFKDITKEDIDALYAFYDALFDVYDNFWHAFESNPEEAIQLLNESPYDSKDDINDDTKIKVRVKKQ